MHVYCFSITVETDHVITEQMFPKVDMMGDVSYNKISKRFPYTDMLLARFTKGGRNIMHM